MPCPATRRWVSALIPAALIVAVAFPAAAACKVEDIEITRWTWERDRGWTNVAGELVNRCAEPTGIQLQLTFRDEAGRVVTVDDSWLANQRDIPAGATHAFQLRLRANATTRSAAIRVTDIRRWGR
jgi:hypothetical protein